MSEINDLIAETTGRIFADLGDPQTIINAGDKDWRTPLWSALEEAGLTSAMVPEELGGAGIPLGAAFNIAKIAGAHAVAVPLIETLVSGWLLGKAGIAAPDGMMTIAPSNRHTGFTLDGDGKLSGSASRVPFAGEVAHYAVLAQGPDGTNHGVLLSSDMVTVTPGQTIAAETLGTISCEGVSPVDAKPLDGVSLDALMQFGAVLRSMQMVGAMEALLDMSVSYAQERVAFGRTISKYQAVQHNLARMAGETAASVAIATSSAYALETATEFGDGIFIEAASAKIRVGEAAGECAAIAHQAHGAIGYTMEHPLHRFAQRLWAWRDDFGDEAEWAERLGCHYTAKGGSQMWPTVTAA